jgi:hypothetical protein
MAPSERKSKKEKTVFFILAFVCIRKDKGLLQGTATPTFGGFLPGAEGRKERFCMSEMLLSATAKQPVSLTYFYAPCGQNFFPLFAKIVSFTPQLKIQNGW